MRCLKFLDVRCLEWIPKYVIACCVLHNICILQGDVMDLEPEDIRNDADNGNNEARHNGDDRERRRLGNIKRNQLCTILNQ